MAKITLIITDTHFGIRQNSQTWLDTQVNALRTEFLPKIKELKDKGHLVHVVHCGDVFDSRSSINPYTASVVRGLFIEMAQLCPVIIVSGNHDFYSPSDDAYSALDLIFFGIKNIIIVKNKCLNIEDDLYVPWYEFDKEDELAKWLNWCNPKNIFCHTDLSRISVVQRTMLSNTNVYSGHIHGPAKDGNFVTLGSTFALTFADHDAPHGYHILYPNGTLEFIPLNSIIKFYRIYKDDIQYIDPEKYKNDYLEIYVNKLDLLDESYAQKLEKITKTIRNVSIIPLLEEKNANESVDFSSYNIEQLCKNNVPKQLQTKLQEIIDINKAL